MLPAPRLLLILALSLPLALAPLVLGPKFWVIHCALALVLLALVGADWAALRRAKPLLKPQLPRVVGVGDALVAQVEVTQAAAWTLQARLRAETAPPLEPGADMVIALRPGANLIQMPLLAPRRGTGAWEALWVQLEGPLGLLRWVRRMPIAAASIAVVPSMARVRRVLVEHFGASIYERGSHLQRWGGEGSEFDALGSYQPGMDLRIVDWKTSARHQQLRARYFRLERNQRVLLCLDTGRLMADPIGELERLDHAIHACLVLAVAALQAGDGVGLYAYDAKPGGLVPPATGMRHWARLREATARLVPRDVETNHLLGIERLLNQAGRRSLVVVFTDFVDSTSGELMIENLSLLAKRHLVLFVAFDDPALEENPNLPLDTVGRLAEEVVAGDLREARQRVLAKLRRSGVEVISGPPHRSTLDLLTRYVRIKRRQLIG